MKVLILIGTRADIIKMSPLIKLFNQDIKVDLYVFYSGQHGSLGFDRIKEFGLSKIKQLYILDWKQITTQFNSQILKINPHVLVVHGDTYTALLGSLLGYKNNIKIAHVEAGLRSYNIYNPFPEEFNRVLISKIATFHFAPTITAYKNLLDEGVLEKNIFLTGNTIVQVVKNQRSRALKSKMNYILVTTHRREGWHLIPQLMTKIIIKILSIYPNIYFIILPHPNPIITNVYEKTLRHFSRVILEKNLKYSKTIELLRNSLFIVSDSCGMQEEAGILGVPIVIIRRKTERPESLKSKIAILTGFSEKIILQSITKLIVYKNIRQKMKKKINDFGDQSASKRIYNILKGLEK